MASNKKYGRGTGFYFSEEDLRRLEKAIDILNKYNKALESMSGVTAQKYMDIQDVTERYEKELKKINYHTTDDLKLLQSQYNQMQRIYQQEKEIEKTKSKYSYTDRELQKQTEKFNRLTVADTKEHIAQQEQLYKLKQRAAKEMADENKSAKKRAESTEKYVKLYERLNAQIQKERRNEGIKDAKKSFIENGVGSLFGVNSETIKSVKDGTYKWQVLTNVFQKAVELFSNSVKQSIQANYDTTENTLNNITASNRMSWNGGNFSLGGKAYNGYSMLDSAVKDQLKTEGLYNNIAVKDVVEATTKLTTQEGLGITDAINKGLQDTIIKYIVPYLDTSSEAYTNLEYLMPRNF